MGTTPQCGLLCGWPWPCCPPTQVPLCCTAGAGRVPSLPRVPSALWMPPGGSLGWETAIPDGGRGASLPSYSVGNSRGEDRPRSQSCQGPAGSDGKKHTGQVRYVFLYLKKNILGCGVRRVHLSWLRGGHRFQKESLGQKHMGRTRGSGEGLHPPAPLGRVGYSMYRWAVPSRPHGPAGMWPSWLAHSVTPRRRTG